MSQIHWFDSLALKQYDNQHPNGIPIVLIPPVHVSSHFDHNGHHCTGTQVPLRLMTVPKSQGLTLEQVKIGLGKREFCIGLTCVALSRATELTSLWTLLTLIVGGN